MSPRRYRMDKRQASRDDTRQRILEAVRELLASEGPPDLSMAAVARGADVSRLTIYYQFGSRAGLLEALYDSLAIRGGMHRMADAFQEPDLSSALAKVIQTFVRFWATDRAVMRRLRAMGNLDAEIGTGIRARDARRSQIARELLTRGGMKGKGATARQAQLVAVVSMLTSFETYDSLAQSGLGDDEIVEALTNLAWCAAGSGPLPKRPGSVRQ